MEFFAFKLILITEERVPQRSVYLSQDSSLSIQDQAAVGVFFCSTRQLPNIHRLINYKCSANSLGLLLNSSYSLNELIFLV